MVAVITVWFVLQGLGKARKAVGADGGDLLKVSYG